LRHSHLKIALTTLLIASLACSIGNDREATAQALSAALDQTATAAAVNAPDPAALLQTAEAEATAQSASSAATQAAQTGELAAGQAATASFIAPMINDLPTYGVDPSVGTPGWMHPPVTLDITGYMQYDYATQFAGTVARDFAVSSDITWNTKTGLSGCGFAFRADDAGNQYLAIATRGADGHVVFVTMANNKVKADKDFYAAVPIDPSNDATNRFTVVGRGSQFAMYINGVRVGEADGNAKTGDAVGINYERGFVALVGLSESGRTICAFNNTWLWLIN